MSYSILKLMTLFDRQFPLMLHAVLHRYPILVVGSDSEVVDDFVKSLAEIAPHRHRVVFWRDFTTEDELLSLLEEERHDFEASRVIVCSLSNSLRLVIDRITSFTAWIIGVSLGEKSLGLTIDELMVDRLLTVILASSPNCGILRVYGPSDAEFKMARPLPAKPTIESHILSKILGRKKQALERIRRLLRKSLRGQSLAGNFIDSFLDLEEEAEMVTRDMFVEEISAFVHAARRAVTILTRVRLVREFGINVRLTERNLFEAAGWNIGGLSSFVRFIGAEWHEDFSDCVTDDTLLGLGSWVDSMWGA